MKRISSNIRQYREYEGEGIILDTKLLDIVSKDMEEHQGLLTIDKELWGLERFFPEKKDNPTFNEMLTPWVGAKVTAEITPETIESFTPFIEEHDRLGLLPAFLERGRNGYTKRVVDLGTIIDISLLYRFRPSTESLHILEVGGGYGRLAEAMMGVFGEQVKYTMVDAVPITLVYAYQYLRKAFPGKRVGLYPYHYSARREWDCIIVPSWLFERFNKQEYDIGICIASMQEMNQEQIDYYIDLFDRLVLKDGRIYLFNSRDYFDREFIYPANWRLLYKHNTPKSWSPHFPAEIFEPTDSDQTERNSRIDSRYYQELFKAYRETYQRYLAQARVQTNQIQTLREELRQSYPERQLMRLWRRIRRKI